MYEMYQVYYKPQDETVFVRRNFANSNNILLLPISKFYSRIILRKMDFDQLWVKDMHILSDKNIQ